MDVYGIVEPTWNEAWLKMIDGPRGEQRVDPNVGEIFYDSTDCKLCKNAFPLPFFGIYRSKPRMIASSQEDQLQVKKERDPLKRRTWPSITVAYKHTLNM